MKIALIDVTVTVSFGGVQTAVWELARALHDQGHQITVYGGEGPIRPELGGRRIDVHCFAFTPRQRFPNLGTRFRKLAERWSFSRQARAAVAAGGHDWIILTKPFDFFWPRLLAGSKTQFAYMSNGTDHMAGDRYLARRISAWLACSHFNAWQVGSHYRCLPAVMFNGVDVERFSPSARDPALRQRLGVGEKDFLFAFAGRLVGWKGLHIAIQALAHAALRDLPVRLLIVGDGEAKARWQALALSLGVADRVLFHAAVPHQQLPAFYASADGAVFPSLADEAFGITIAEAMACGIPVVASYNGGIPEVVGNEGSAGVLFEVGNVAQCAQAMATLVTAPEARTVMGQRARERIVRQFTWTLAANRLLAVLRDKSAQ